MIEVPLRLDGSPETAATGAAALNKSKESARQTPTLFSVVTAVTQCYFWDSHNSTWKSGGCHVSSNATSSFSSP